MSGLIDRQKAYNYIKGRCYPVQHDITSVEPGMTLDGIRQCFNEMPSAEPRWIPVTERSPKETGYYLTSTEYNDVLHDFFCDGKWETAERFWYKVVAWMPLPEPYEEVDK